MSRRELLIWQAVTVVIASFVAASMALTIARANLSAALSRDLQTQIAQTAPTLTVPTATPQGTPIGYFSCKTEFDQNGVQFEDCGDRWNLYVTRRP